IARAFHPKPKSKPSEPSSTPKPENAEEVVLQIDRAYVRHAHAQGNIAPPALDADADEVRAHLGVHGNVFTLDIDGAKTTLRSPKIPTQTASITGDGTGHLSVPLKNAADLTMSGDLRGELGEIPFTAHAGLTKDKVDATVDVARAEPAAIT